MNKPLSFRPSAFYYRQALRAARTRGDAIKLGLKLVVEIEHHKQWIRDHGMMPPKWLVMRSEQAEKEWGEVVPFPRKAPDSETAG